MKTTRILLIALALAFLCQAAHIALAETPEGFKSIFNGKDLTGWEGNKDFWSVEDGVITGLTTAEKTTKANTFLIWRDGKPADFELHLKFKMLTHNSGVQYRSKELTDFAMQGYQADMDESHTYTGFLYEERGRGILVKRGTKQVVTADGKKEIVGKTAEDKDISASIKKGDWNDYVIICQGNHIIQKLNGITTVDLTDNQESKRAMSGLIGLQLHAGKPMKVQFKDIYLKEFAATTQDSGATSKPAAAAAPAGPGLGLLFTALLMVAGVAAFTCTTKQSHA